MNDLVSKIFWPVGRPSSYTSRPVALINALGLEQAPISFLHHGGSGESRVPWLSILSRSDPYPGDSAVLSPLFLRYAIPNVIWIDLYDDWSLAPEMHWAIRALARRNYRALRSSGEADRILITVNSNYMLNKFADCRPRLLPNGVDASLAEVDRSTDEVRRLLVMGNFGVKRTNYGLMRELMMVPDVEEVVCVAADRGVEEVVRSLSYMQRKKVEMLPKSPLDKLFGLFGRRTLLGVPHVVSDYTISQDPMKTYQAAALGVRSLVPYELLQPNLVADHALALGPGVEIERLVRGAFDSEPLSDGARRQFALENAWQARASDLREWICDREV